MAGGAGSNVLVFVVCIYEPFSTCIQYSTKAVLSSWVWRRFNVLVFVVCIYEPFSTCIPDPPYSHGSSGLDDADWLDTGICGKLVLDETFAVTVIAF